MTTAPAADTPAQVVAEDGEVHVEGPEGITYSFTPHAALETSNRLLAGGMEANGQRLKKNLTYRGQDHKR
jgi:hypothetical protein